MNRLRKYYDIVKPNNLGVARELGYAHTTILQNKERDKPTAKVAEDFASYLSEMISYLEDFSIPSLDILVNKMHIPRTELAREIGTCSQRVTKALLKEGKTRRDVEWKLGFYRVRLLNQLREI